MKKDEWFAVKTLYTLKAKGKPKNLDKRYRKNGFMAEERIVLVKAKSVDAAIKKAEKEALAYEHSWENQYGQKIEEKYIGACDAFKMYKAPGELREVFSTTWCIPEGATDKEIVDMRLGEKVAKSTEKKILHKLFSAKKK